MGWIIKNDIIGPEYQVSLFSKDELPTWGEMYLCYKDKIFTYIEKIDKSLDPYWKIPYNKFIVSLVCNQLNKMIFEDHYDISKIKLNGIDEEYKIKDLRFSCIKPDDPIESVKEWFDNMFCMTNCPPPIYTLLNPHDGSKSIFITNNWTRIVVNELKDIQLYPTFILDTDTCSNTMYMITPEDEDFQVVMDYMFKPYMSYFDEPVGWKDDCGFKAPKGPIILGYDSASNACEACYLDH